MSVRDLEPLITSLHLDKEASTLYWDISKQRAWPGKIQSLTGIAVSNVAHYGISNHEIAYRVLETATQALNNYSPENIICFIMISTPLRFGTPQHNPNFSGEYDYQSFAPYTDFVPEKMKPWARRIIEDYNDYDYLHESYINVLAVKSHLTKLGINTIILDSGLWRKFGREYSHPTKQNCFKLFSEILEIQLDPLTQVGFEKGWFEATIKFPRERSMWAAWWLHGFDSWPPEIDIIEIYTDDVNNPKEIRHEPNIHWRNDKEELTSYGRNKFLLRDSDKRFVNFARYLVLRIRRSIMLLNTRKQLWIQYNWRRLRTSNKACREISSRVSNNLLWTM